MTRRPAMTTTEVLVALFIMALGVIAILTLFPLGILNMTQALRDDRTAQSATTADGRIRWYWKTMVVENQSDTGLSGAPNTYNSAFDNPGGGWPALTAANANEPSYPVFVDPIGIESQGAPNYVGNSTSIPRRSLTLISTGANRPNMAIATCTMTDGITYGMNGNADTTSTGGVVERDMRYNWLWVLQRPMNKNPNTVTMQVVVFEKRAPRFYAANAEIVYTGVTIAPNTTSLQLPLTSGLQKGNWIMDATNSGAVRHAIFYRVASATDNGGGNLDVELDSPLRRIDGNSTSYGGTIVVMTGVADVFTRPNLTP